jgi:aryl-alcohol dehydrogenase-like predicted oxidoreductase
MKLGLGTVQFGQAYGVSNRMGQVSSDDVRTILDRAAAAGIRVLDTAANYGEAETVLAGQNTQSFRIVTKTASAKNGIDAVIARARQSALALGADTLLVHAAADLQDEALWPALQKLKSDGVFARIGISAYASDDPAALAARFKPDVMQLAISMLDQRLIRDGTLAQLKDLNVEVHARSIFLQGLLFLDTLPQKLRHAGPALADITRRKGVASSQRLRSSSGFMPEPSRNKHLPDCARLRQSWPPRNHPASARRAARRVPRRHLPGRPKPACHRLRRS